MHKNLKIVSDTRHSKDGCKTAKEGEQPSPRVSEPQYQRSFRNGCVLCNVFSYHFRILLRGLLLGEPLCAVEIPACPPLGANKLQIMLGPPCLSLRRA